MDRRKALENPSSDSPTLYALLERSVSSSTTATVNPRLAYCSALCRPMIPAPMTQTSACSSVSTGSMCVADAGDSDMTCQFLPTGRNV